MNQTGHYRLIDGHWQKVSESAQVESALGRTSCWFPRNGAKYFDTMAQRTFHNKQEKRQWMQEKGVREIEADWHNPLKGLAESRARGQKVFSGG